MAPKPRSNQQQYSRHIPSSAIANFKGAILRYYTLQGRSFPWRRKSCTNYERIVSEVLLQRTQANTVKAYFPSFRSRYPSWKRLALSGYNELLHFLKPIGLSRQRTPRLRALAQAMAGRRGRFPTTRDKIDELPAVGQYIGNAIELFIHGRPKPLLDVNMARVLERYFGKRKLADIRYDPYLQELAERVVQHARSAEINWGIIDLGAVICKASRPGCMRCPLKRNCISADY